MVVNKLLAMVECVILSSTGKLRCYLAGELFEEFSNQLEFLQELKDTLGTSAVRFPCFPRKFKKKNAFIRLHEMLAVFLKCIKKIFFILFWSNLHLFEILVYECATFCETTIFKPLKGCFEVT